MQTAVLAAVFLLLLAWTIRRLLLLRAEAAETALLLRDAREGLERLRAQAERDALVLRNELGRRAGETIFRPETPVRDAFRAHPRAERAFVANRRSGIIRIEWRGDETIAEACRLYDIDEVKLLRDLNALR